MLYIMYRVAQRSKLSYFVHIVAEYWPVFTIFSARQHICYSALYAIARPSVCLYLSVTRVDQSKTVEVRIPQPSPQSSPMTL